MAICTVYIGDVTRFQRVFVNVALIINHGKDEKLFVLKMAKEREVILST